MCRVFRIFEEIYKPMKYTFGISYGNAPRYNTYVEFDIDLSDEDASFLKNWLLQNGPCDYGYLEGDNEKLFNVINDACSEAVFDRCNKDRILAGEQPVDYWNFEWPSITEFEWDHRLLD